MRSLVLAFVVVVALDFVPGARAWAAPLEIPLTVEEPAGAGPRLVHVTSGVPVPDSCADTRWALFDGAHEIAVQVAPLTVTLPRWVLLDFAVTLGSHERRALILRHVDPTVVAAAPSRRTTLTLQTRGAPGAIAALLEGGALGRELRVTAVGAFGVDSLVALRESLRTSWDARGPLRTTLVLDAPLGDARTRTVLPGARVVLRLTLRDGGDALEGELVLHVSSADSTRALKLSALTLGFGDGALMHRVGESGERALLPCGGHGATLELIPAQRWITRGLFAGTERRDEQRLDTRANGGQVIEDGTCLGASFRLQLATPSDTTGAARAFLAPVVALALPSWYAALGTFGFERFGTLADERAAYRAWGLRDSLPSRRWSWPPQLPPVTGFQVSAHDVDVQNDLESDDLAQNLMQMARTGDRGWFDRAGAWARYVKWEMTPRTDGFAYASDGYWEGPQQAVHRPRAWWPDRALYTREDSLLLANDVGPGRATADHVWAGGLVDWYALTGDRDALAAAIDLAEIGERYFGWREPGARSSALGGGRFLARHLWNILRVSEGTQDPHWRALAMHLARIDSASSTWDPRGFYGERDPRHPGMRVVTPFFAGIEARTLARLAQVGGAAWPTERLIAMARFVARSGLDPANGWSGDYWLVPDAPSDAVQHVAQDDYREAQGVHFPVYDPVNTLALTDVLDLGYRATQDTTLLAGARRIYERGMRRFFREPYARADALADQVGRYASSLEGYSPRSICFPDNGDLPYVAGFLADAARAGR